MLKRHLRQQGLLFGRVTNSFYLLGPPWLCSGRLACKVCFHERLRRTSVTTPSKPPFFAIEMWLGLALMKA